MSGGSDAAGAPRTLRLTLAYDGAAFHGWQRQPGLRTVQGELEDVARRVLREPLEVVGASRTDAGVHARGQVAHLRAGSRIPADRLALAIGHRLPPDVVLLRLRDTHAAFHAIRDARSKRYRYQLHAHPQRPVGPGARTAWHVWHPLDLDRMRSAARRLVGRHDFRSFASAGDARRTSVRTVRRVDIDRRGDLVRIDVQGDGFLYNMVRNIAGTLVEVGRGHWAPERISEIIAARDRRAAGPTAPAQGLTLLHIFYPPPPAPGPVEMARGA